MTKFGDGAFFSLPSSEATVSEMFMLFCLNKWRNGLQVIQFLIQKA